MRLINLFREMDRKQTRLKDRIRNEYERIMEQLERRPLRMDLFTFMEEDVYQLAMEHRKENPFRRYLERYPLYVFVRQGTTGAGRQETV